MWWGRGVTIQPCWAQEGLLPAAPGDPTLCLLSAAALGGAEAASRWGAFVAFVELLEKLLLQSIVVPFDALLQLLSMIMVLWGLCVQEHRAATFFARNEVSNVGPIIKASKGREHNCRLLSNKLKKH